MSLEYQQYLEEYEKLPEACIVTQFPISLDIELTNRCNLKCQMCPHHGPDRINQRIPQDMDFGLFQKIIDEGSEKGLKSIKLNFAGEPLLYPELRKAIWYAKSKGILDVRINTNGIFLDDWMAQELISSDLDLLIVTDYDSEVQYENLFHLNILKRTGGFENPKIQVKTNDLEKWLDVADEIIENNYYKYDLNEDFTPSKFKCPQPWQRFLILADGMVCSCSCGIILNEKILGNAWNFSLEELWNGRQMSFLRYCHEARDSHLLKQCRMCPARKEYIKKNKD